MKALLVAITMLAFGCSNDITKTTEPTKTPNTRLSMTNKNPNEQASLKRLIIDAPTNIILSNEVKTDSIYGEFEEVTIDWGMLKKKNYDFVYYLFTTDNAVKIDSITFNDTLTQATKQMKGALITKSIGMTGDGVLPITMVNDTLLGNTRFWDKNVDTNFVMTIFGRDTLTKQLTKLVVKFKFLQDVNTIVCDSVKCTRYGTDTTTIKVSKDFTFNGLNVASDMVILDNDTLNILDGHYALNSDTTTANKILSPFLTYSMPLTNLTDSVLVNLHSYNDINIQNGFSIFNIPNEYYVASNTKSITIKKQQFSGAYKK